MKRKLYAIAMVLFVGPVLALAAKASEVPGVGNFEKLNDHVFRGAQPTPQGFKSLAAMGIRTVLDLQPFGDKRSTDEQRAVEEAGMQYINLGMKGMERMPDDKIQKALALLEDTKTGPVFVHCHRGADRTGGIIACYRMDHDHWTAHQALAEARAMGMSWYQLAVQRSVMEFKPHTGGQEVAASDSGLAPPAATLSVVQ